MSKKIKGVIPELRFPEFISMGSWKNYRLGEIADRITEKVGDTELTTLSISAGTGFVSQEDKFSRDISGKQYKNYIRIIKGDFSYNKGNSKKFPQGCIYELSEYEEAAVPNAFISFRFKDSYISGFYKGYFERNFHGRQLVKYITSGARMDGLLNIKPSDFFSIILPTPEEKNEQQKIADCLSSIDELIFAEEKKLLLLNDYKKGWMQKLFPAEGKTIPEWRFPEFKNNKSWESDLISNVISTIKPPKKLRSSEYKISGRYPIVDQGQNEFCGWTDDESTLVNFNKKVLIFGDHTCTVKLVARPFAQGADGIKIISTNKKISVDFLFQYLCHSPVGSNSYKRHFSDLKEKRISFPNFDGGEQQKITEFLFNIDILIEKQEVKIYKLKQHKKALIQGLYPDVEEVL